MVTTCLYLVVVEVGQIVQNTAMILHPPPSQKSYDSRTDSSKSSNTEGLQETKMREPEQAQLQVKMKTLELELSDKDGGVECHVGGRAQAARRN